MPFQLHTAKGRKGEKYQRSAAPKLGGWNADVPFGTLPFGEFSQLKNYRKVRPTEIEVRTGYKTYPKTGNYTPLAKTEYRLDTAFRDITFYYDGAGNLGVLILNQINGSQYAATLITGGITADTKVYAQQFNTYLCYTVYGFGVFALQPADSGLVGWNAPIQLGKILATPPKQYSFPDTITGDLIVYDTKHNGIAQIRAGLGRDAVEFTQNFAIAEKEPTKIRVDLGTTYYNPDTPETDAAFTGSLAPSVHTIADTKLFGRWIFGKNDNAIPDFFLTAPRAKSATNHLRTNGWGYKIVFLHEETDVKGQKFTHRSSPSVDFWVRDSIYMPALTLYQPEGTWDPADTNFHFPHQLFPSNTPPSPEWTIYPPNGFDYEQTLLRVPSREAVQALQNLFKAAFNDTGSGGTDTADPYFATAMWLMWNPHADADMHWLTPYKVEVPVSELKSAPMTIFNWADFTIPADVVAIEIYRTAYAQPDDKDNATLSPLFQPYRYGLVGTLTASKNTFTDDTSDQAIDFGTTPDRYIGFLQDQISGGCMTVYNEDHLVLGDTITGYYVNAPTNLVQAFAYDRLGSFADNFLPADLIGDAGDGLPQMAIYLQYTDTDGNTSDITAIPIDISTAITAGVAIAIVPPRGYAFNIVSISVWQGEYVGPGRTFKLLTTVNLPATEIFATKAAMSVAVGTPAKTIVNSKDPGAIDWNASQDIFTWPQENFLLIHQTSPVTGFGVTIGMLTVFCDRATWATDLGTRTEEKSRDVGMISRWAGTTIQKIPFFLSQFGLYVSEPSGVRKFPNDVESELLKYLVEEIPGVGQLANARRASMKWLGQRDELWLWMPPSYDLGGNLPGKCFIYKIPGMREVVSYEFDITNEIHSNRIIFNEHADGKLFCAFNGEVDLGGGSFAPTMFVQDNDVDTDWNGQAFWEMMLGLDVPEVKKVLRCVMMTAEVHAKLSRITGLPRTDGLTSLLHGNINDNASIKPLTIRGTGATQQIYFNCATSVYDTYGYTPVIRCITEPDQSGNHRATFQSVEVLFFSKHKHPL